jgi:hypothetical protein
LNDGTLHFVTDYWKVNWIIKRNPCPFPRIANTLQ